MFAPRQLKLYYYSALRYQGLPNHLFDMATQHIALNPKYGRQELFLHYMLSHTP